MMTEDDVPTQAPAPTAATPAVAASTASPAPSATVATAAIPEPRGYRWKMKLLGQPLHSERLEHETLGKPTALAVFASDCISSCAYASEEILHVLIPVVGLAAFSLVTPITLLLLVVLGFLILSYRQTIKAYPSAGGAYIVTRDNFGLLPAQVAGVALLTDYVLTVAVSTAAGSAALASAFPGLASYTLWISIGFVILIAYGNLRGTKESGKLFAAPTYFFVAVMVILLLIGLGREIFGSLPVQAGDVKGMLTQTHAKSNAIFYGAGLLIFLKAFASGGAAVTGVEAISNGVPAFRPPAWRNARDTLVYMGALLGTMFLGLSFLASKVHATPYENGTPTVISQVGKLVFGQSAAGHAMFFALQAGTMLILVLAANTSFADFPRLASFHAGDNFMPRQFMVRGHRLVFSNGIIFLAVAAIVTLLGTGGEVSRLIPLYAIGVFTSFTLSQAGMTKHHFRLKEKGWKTGAWINGVGAVLSFLVLIIVASMKFTEGAWVIMLLVPIMVVGLVRLNKTYEAEDRELHEDAKKAAETPALRRHSVIVLVDKLDVAAARAMQYAKTLMPDDLRAVHCDVDPWATDQLTEAWQNLGFDRFPLDIIECPDRRIPRATLELAADLVADGDTELTVLVPRREYTKVWHRLLHDRSSNSISAALATLPHCNVTVVPYHLGSSVTSSAEAELLAAERPAEVAPAAREQLRENGRAARHVDVSILPDQRDRIAGCAIRTPIVVAGRVTAVRVQPWGNAPTLECTLADETGSITVAFLGRRSISGIRVGTVMSVAGVAGQHHGMRAILNPTYEFVSVPTMPEHPGEHH
jgi:amino acid transporter